MTTKLYVPAGELAGLTLTSNGGRSWKVIELLSNSGIPNATGGYFSKGYLVLDVDTQETGFLKALDFSSSLESHDPVGALFAQTNAYRFEVDLLNVCRTRRLDRVVVALDDGTYRPPNNPLLPVPFIVFSRADGDIRAFIAGRAFTAAWALRCLHHVATGIKQLHNQQHVHNDLKPSNVLVFGETSKIGDLGRAVDVANRAPHSYLSYTGDFNYAPPEMLYGSAAPSWEQRLRSDLYQLGSFAAFLLTHRHLNDYLHSELELQYWPSRWNGPVEGQFELVKPHVIEAFERIFVQLKAGLTHTLGPRFAENVLPLLMQLCHPDPAQRGHPQNRVGHQSPYSLERFVSQLNLLASRAEYELKSVVIGRP